MFELFERNMSRESGERRHYFEGLNRYSEFFNTD